MTDVDSEREKLIRLRKLLIDSFNLEGLHLLCSDMGLDYEELAGSTKSMKAQNLITYLQRRGELQRLLDEVKSQRPNADWPEFSPTLDTTVGENKRGASASGDQVGGDKITTGDISDVSGAGIGEKAQGVKTGDVGGSVITAQGNVTLGRSHRDEQYESALNWDGQRRMRGYDLAERDLSGLYLANADLRGADLRGADLQDTDLSGADLSGANLDQAKLRGARYTISTNWPEGFSPEAVGATLVDDDSTPTKEASEVDITADTYIEKKTGLEMIRIPAGNFIYGKDNRLEYLPEFWIARTPITNAQYVQFVKSEGRHSPGHWKGLRPRAEIADHPVHHVSWGEARDYAKWAGLVLPTEKEWEKAARGTDGLIYPWANEWREGCCNTAEAGINDTTPVGLFSPQGDSPFGCVDMAGNVWEWTETRGKIYYIMCGGSFLLDRNHARSTYRWEYQDTHRGNNRSLGFRVVRRPPPE